jgi:hypothetical protein
MSEAALTDHTKRRRLPRPADTEWVTDAELIRRSGVPERTMRANLAIWDSSPNFGFPPKIKLYGDRRHWPSVQAFFRRAAEAKIPALSGSNRR